MKLQAARNVKRELERMFTTRTRGDRMGRFALGLAPGAEPEQYAIAVRAPSEQDIREGDLEVIRARTGGEVEVRYTGSIRPLASPASALDWQRPGIGTAVAHHRCSTGTLGFFARRTLDGTIGFVSNNHVIALQDLGQDGDDVVHPAPEDGGEQPQHVIGHLVGGYPQINRPRARVDCAFARLLPGIEHDGETLDAGQRVSLDLAEPHGTSRVAKIGRTTGMTEGRISAIELNDVEVEYSFGRVRFDGQIEIESAGASAFSRAGDSGALVFSRPDNHPVALLFAASPMGGAANVGLTYANPIDAVLTALGVTLVG